MGLKLFIKSVEYLNPLSTNPTKRSNPQKQFVGVMFDYFVGLTLKKLTQFMSLISFYTPLNHQDFLLFSWGVNRYQWHGNI